MSCPFSPYSPFFTSGLLSGSSGSSSPISPYRERRDTSSSLPLAPKFQSSVDESSAFYLTLQPKRGSTEFRSFLSLDLAESQSLRSASIRRKASRTSKSTSLSARFFPSLGQSPPLPFETKGRPSKVHPFGPQDKSPRRSRSKEWSPKDHVTPYSSSPLRGRVGSGSSASLPSPKPVPSSSALPEVPASFSERKLRSSQAPRLPPLRFCPLTSTEVLPSTSSNLSRLPEKVILSSKRSSSVSTGYRTGNHSAALARLEGRVTAANRKTSRVRRNFMDMSDDEDSIPPSIKVPSSFRAAFFESEESILPITPPPTSEFFDADLLPNQNSDAEEFKQQSKVDSLVPLVSFLDFWDDDRSRHWSSFIEVTSVI